LRVGDRLGDIQISAVDVVPFSHDFTYDILPASDSGIYFAAGVPVGSTLHSRATSNMPQRTRAAWANEQQDRQGNGPCG
jgi:hypothetical protein